MDSQHSFSLYSWKRAESKKNREQVQGETFFSSLQRNKISVVEQTKLQISTETIIRVREWVQLTALWIVVAGNLRLKSSRLGDGAVICETWRTCALWSTFLFRLFIFDTINQDRRGVVDQCRKLKKLKIEQSRCVLITVNRLWLAGVMWSYALITFQRDPHNSHGNRI